MKSETVTAQMTESYRWVLSSDAYYAVQGGSNVCVCA